MTDLLTTKEVQEQLKVDRVTVYRMLSDGRLKGIKVGQQWRFPREEVEGLLSGNRSRDAGGFSPPSEILPLACIQVIQSVFAEIAEVAAIVTSPDGEPLTEISNSCAFCSCIQSTEAGRQACIASWRRLAEEPDHRPAFTTCHAGLQYARARIEIEGKLAAILVAGQFYADEPNPAEEAARIQHLAAAYELDANTLAAAAAELTTLDGRMRSQIEKWLAKVAKTFEKVGCERAELIGRLRRIAAMSSLDAPLN
ncbi:MAG: PocR ligand-binding domain-containing protein [Anaerolineae bacterium]